MNIYTFHRQDGFYSVELRDDAEAALCIPLNPGTLKVVNQNTGKTIFDAGQSEKAEINWWGNNSHIKTVHL